jgi:hypothetical protein
MRTMICGNNKGTAPSYSFVRIRKVRRFQLLDDFDLLCLHSLDYSCIPFIRFKPYQSQILRMPIPGPAIKYQIKIGAIIRGIFK